MKYQNIIFDWSGVINDNFLTGYLTIAKVFEKLGHRPLSEEEFRNEFCLPYMNFYNKFFPNLELENQKKLYI